MLADLSRLSILFINFMSLDIEAAKMLLYNFLFGTLMTNLHV